MSEAAAQPAPDLPQTLEGLAALLGDLAAENRRLFEEAVRISRAPMSQDDRNVVLMLVHRAADVEGIERAVLDKLNQEVRLRTVQELWEKANVPDLAPVPEPDPASRRHRHRASRKRDTSQPPLMRSVKGMIPLGAIGAAARHSWPAAHPALAGTIATAAVGIAATTAAVVPNSAATFGLGGGSAPAPAASIWSAVPVPAGGPGRIASAVTHPGNARTLTLLAPPTVPAYDPPAPDGGSQDPGPQSPSLPVPVPQVSLIVTGSLDLGAGSSGQIRLTAFGGPVSWQASASAAGMNLDVASGTLAAGHSATIGVSIIADLQALAGPGSVTITYGGGKTAVVSVSWTTVPLPLPSPAESVLPSLPDVLPSVSVP
jgi:hypothetical protein